MKKRTLIMAVIILLCFSLCGCGSAGGNNINLDLTPTTLNGGKMVTPEIEEDKSVIKTDSLESETTEVNIYNVKSLSISIVSSMNDVKLDSLTLRYFRVKVHEGVISADDNRARESVQPRLISQFGKFIEIEYAKPIQVDINNLSVFFSAEFDKVSKITDKVIKLTKEDSGENAVGVIELDSTKGILLEICAEIEESE